ncbi:head-tail connector protein [Abyssicoccus albus]|uniref:head-tail connector protein n=1 Tax=Abyssicoccus albus TaxID=1817405 RepID=UPI00097E37BF|nr:head-tail connector protein [Abyssicoccus albus]AQL56418.1 hypothetical protein BVH56_05540 [Abyssicoccus albus]
MELQTIKGHLRIDHDFEDKEISHYIKWAESEVKDSVSTSKTRNEDFFVDNIHFEKAVTLLTSHYFENRLPQTNLTLSELPFGVISAIHKLRGDYYE